MTFDSPDPVLDARAANDTTANAILRKGPADGTLMILRPPWTNDVLADKIKVPIVSPDVGAQLATYKRTKASEDAGTLRVYEFVRVEDVTS